MFDLWSGKFLNFIFDCIDPLRAEKVWFSVELYSTGYIIEWWPYDQTLLSEGKYETISRKVWVSNKRLLECDYCVQRVWEGKRWQLEAIL